MVYSNIKSNSSVSFLVRLKNRIGKIISNRFPLNSIRILGVRICGYSVGKNVYIGEDFLIVNTVSEDNTWLEIQDRVSIAPRVTIVLASDPNWSNLTKEVKPIRGKVILKNDCWLGTGVIVLPNITIGEYSIVAAGSVVTKDVNDFDVVAGIPARIIKKLDKNLFVK